MGRVQDRGGARVGVGQGRVREHDLPGGEPPRGGVQDPARRDYVSADEVLDALAAAGVDLKDTTAGADWSLRAAVPRQGASRGGLHRSATTDESSGDTGLDEFLTFP